MVGDNIVIFSLQLVPFVVLLLYIVLEGQGILQPRDAARDLAPDATERIASLILERAENDETINQMRENKSINEIFIQVTATASDRVHIPAAVIGLTLSGSALLFAELLQAPANDQISLPIVSLPLPTQHLFGLLVYVYIVILWIIVVITVYSFRKVHPGQYYEHRYERMNQTSFRETLSDDESFEVWYRSVAGIWLLPVVYVLTLCLIIFAYITL